MSVFGIIKKIFRKSSLLVIIIVMTFYVTEWKNAAYWKQQRILANDVICYYNYLPAAFIYHDLSFKDKPVRGGYSITNDGKRVEKMSMGISYFYAPFFFAAMAYVKAARLPMNEYSMPFEFAISLSSLVFALLAMIVLRKVLLMFFSDAVAAFVILTIFAGTNIFFYSVYQGPMSHVYNFFLYSCLLYLTVRWHEKPSIKYSVLAGLVIGVTVLARPTNIVVLIVPILFGIISRETLLAKLALIRQHWMKLVIVAFVAFLAWVPQFIYWKSYTGHWLVYSYGKESFFWANPHIILGLFGYRSGWLVYSPLMVLSLVGILFLWKYQRKFFFPVLIFFFVSIYVIFSWWCYWYVGFGLRAMIESTAILALPLGAFFTWLFARKWYLKTIFFLLFFGFIELNLFQTWQYAAGLIHYDGMNKKLYWTMFFKRTWPADYGQLVNRPDYEKAGKGQD